MTSTPTEARPMRFTVITLFPEMITPVTSSSILGRGSDAGAIDVRTVQLRDFATDKHRSVDGTPCGGGAGMVLKVDVVVPAVRAAIAAGLNDGYAAEETAVRFMDPRGQTFRQGTAQTLAHQTRHLILVCGRYEGFDARCFDVSYGSEASPVDVGLLSVGDFILTGGELSALIVIDAVSRLVPGVLGNEESATHESHTPGGLLEHRHYTRPLSYEGLDVPAVLLGGNHAAIDKARTKDAITLTRRRRPELLVQRTRSKQGEKALQKLLADDRVKDLAPVRRTETPPSQGGPPPTPASTTDDTSG